MNTEEQLDLEDLANMTADEIDRAYAAGRCRRLLGLPLEGPDVPTELTFAAPDGGAGS